MASIFNEQTMGRALGDFGVVLFLQQHPDCRLAEGYQVLVTMGDPPPHAAETFAPLIVDMIFDKGNGKLVVGVG